MRTARAILLAFVAVFGALFPAACEGAEAVTLRVALYPYVPERHSVFTLLSQEFQRQNPGLILQLVEVPADQDYYNGGLAALDADVYEIDSILLSDVLGKVAPLQLSMQGFEPTAIEAVTRNGLTYAVPHWMCGNFLFYRKDNVAVRDAVTWADLTGELAKQGRPLLIDLFGRLTLGEWYITMLADRLGTAPAQAAILSSDVPDPAVVADLASILSACPAGSCRSKNLHDRTGYYARAFVRGEGGAYIGYSESLYSALKEIIDNCRTGSPCLSPGEIAVRRLPKLSAASTGEGVGWVDGLAISNTLSDGKREAALKFVEFATSEQAYKLLLQPEWMDAPRYLLPARTGLSLGSDAPLYSDLFAAHQGRKTGTAPRLNAKLQNLSKKLTCGLPIDRTDTSTMANCKLP
jgi:thiamine pyridinylase